MRPASTLKIILPSALLTCVIAHSAVGADNPFRTSSEAPPTAAPQIEPDAVPVAEAPSPVEVAAPIVAPSPVVVQPAPATDAIIAADDLKQPQGHPTRVEIDLEIIEVSQIQDHDQKFDVEFNAYFLWHDPRLAFDPVGGERKRVLAAADLWIPDPLLVDELDVDTRGGETVHVHPDGMVHMNRYYRGTVAGSFDLHEFPLDRHGLEVSLEARGYESDEIEYVIGDVKTVNASRAVPHGWKLEGLASKSSEVRYSRLHESYSQVTAVIQVARDPHFYVWSIVLPLIPIVATAWSVFWMDPKEFSSQVGVGITAMLTVVAYRITIDSSLPPLTYMTRMDYFLLVCQTFVFIAFVATVVIHVLYALDVPHMRARAADLTELCRWLPPVVLVAVCAALALLPVRFGTYVILAPVALAAFWLRAPLVRLPATIVAIVRPETLLSIPPADALPESRAPHASFRVGPKSAGSRTIDRRTA